ncbi:collectin-10 isoform X4 [Rhinatrema bivittatum]|uniref:collectin-10 isoform X4 n=1 Tax=Rhinatrema bivittatum TaxID=194408 RepID=UPI00112A789E|nr:collectin-10 isoform X4 [Rhinatrema bivittatum]
MNGQKKRQLKTYLILAVLSALLARVFCSDADSHPTTDVCSTNTILPGPKGEKGERGNPGEIGKLGKEGPMGMKGEKGDPADVGDQGMIGKIGPIGTKGEKGCKGLSGPAGGKGKAVIAGIRETDEKYYYIVKEERSYRDALTHCRIRGGTLAMPRDEASNSLIADYISKSGLFRVFIGVNDVEKEGQFMYTDNTPLQNYSSWKESEPNDASGHEDCVEMLSSGAWNDVECHLTIYFVCEFMKKKKTDLQRA